MSFRLFIYYCAMCGACAAFLGWVLGRMVAPESPVGDAAAKGFWLGTFVAVGLALVDALWNYSLTQVGPVGVRVLVAMVFGGVGGWLGGAVGQILFGLTQRPALLTLGLILGWTLTGLLIGASIGLFDFLSGYLRDEDTTGVRRKVQHGLLGGGVGGLLGGFLSVLFKAGWAGVFRGKPTELLWSPSAVGFVVLGMCIGLLIGLAQVILREAWVRVEVGFRAGRQMILSKPETTIGRAESCDIGLFGDPGVEHLHARIQQQGDRYVLADADTPGGTFVNGELIDGPTPLRSGDEIRVGNSILRFRERRKRAGADSG